MTWLSSEAFQFQRSMIWQISSSICWPKCQNSYQVSEWRLDWTGFVHSSLFQNFIKGGNLSSLSIPMNTLSGFSYLHTDELGDVDTGPMSFTLLLTWLTQFSKWLFGSTSQLSCSNLEQNAVSISHHHQHSLKPLNISHKATNESVNMCLRFCCAVAYCRFPTLLKPSRKSLERSHLKIEF